MTSMKFWSMTRTMLDEDDDVGDDDMMVIAMMMVMTTMHTLDRPSIPTP